MEVKGMFKEKLALVPEKPGSYQMKNKDGIIIYVGKAKNLKNRLKSYFTGTVTGKTAMLVQDIADFEYIVTSSELESLILEITLIKKYNPKYNILLKDDKSYPYIELTNEKYPRLRVVRNINRKKHKSRLFGPFPNVTAARKTVMMINRLYPLRKCERMPKEVCLYYHLHECLGFCEKDIEKEAIQPMIDEIVTFLKGDSSHIEAKLKEDMMRASENLNFEKAQELKEMLQDIEITLRKQRIDLNKNYNFDLFAYYLDKNYLSIQVFFIREGLLFGRQSDILNSFSNPKEEMIEYIAHFYEKNHLLPKEIVVDESLDDQLLRDYLNIKVMVPKRGDLKKLLTMAIDNAKVSLHEKEETLKRDDEVRRRALDELRDLLHLPQLSRMEAFDNSHLFGTFYVGAMVVYQDFLPQKDDYRKFKIDTKVKDDLSAMREVLYRRYYKVLMEDLEKPDLIVIDGGELQVGIAKEIIDSLHLHIPIIGLKKDQKHRTNSIINEYGETLEVSPKSDVFLFLTRMQDEVHRFAISYHRQIKSKGSLASVLDLAPGVGEVRRRELLKKFGSLKRLKEATEEELSQVVPVDVAKALVSYLRDI